MIQEVGGTDETKEIYRWDVAEDGTWYVSVKIQTIGKGSKGIRCVDEYPL